MLMLILGCLGAALTKVMARYVRVLFYGDYLLGQFVNV